MDFKSINEGIFTTKRINPRYYEVENILKIMDKTIYKAGGDMINFLGVFS